MYMCMYIYIWLNHFAVYLKLTQHCKLTILQLRKRKNTAFESINVRLNKHKKQKLCSDNWQGFAVVDFAYI